MMADNIPLPSEPAVVRELLAQFGSEVCTVQATLDQVPTLWVPRERLIEVLRFLRNLPKPYVMLYDLSAIDERLRKHRQGQPRPTSRCSITCCRSSETVMCASRLR
jgi:NADH-quinone oxidoreductase subunit C/D